MLRSNPTDIEANLFETVLKYCGHVRQAAFAAAMLSSVAVVSEVAVTASRVNEAMAAPIDLEAEILVPSLMKGINYMPGPVQKLMLRNAKMLLLRSLPRILEGNGLTPQKLATQLGGDGRGIPPELEGQTDELRVLLKDVDEETTWKDLMPELKVFAEGISGEELESALQAFDKAFEVDGDQVVAKK